MGSQCCSNGLTCDTYTEENADSITQKPTPLHPPYVSSKSERSRERKYKKYLSANTQVNRSDVENLKGSSLDKTVSFTGLNVDVEQFNSKFWTIFH